MKIFVLLSFFSLNVLAEGPNLLAQCQTIYQGNKLYSLNYLTEKESVFFGRGPSTYHLFLTKNETSHVYGILLTRTPSPSFQSQVTKVPAFIFEKEYELYFKLLPGPISIGTLVTFDGQKNQWVLLNDRSKSAFPLGLTLAHEENLAGLNKKKFPWQKLPSIPAFITCVISENKDDDSEQKQ